MKSFMFSLVILTLLLNGCTTNMTEKKYLRLINEHLDDTEQALHRVNEDLITVFERDEYWLIKSPATDLKREVEEALQTLEKVDAPIKFQTDHQLLLKYLQAKLEFATIFISYGESGQLDALATLDKVSEALARYHDEMIFTKNEYREKGYQQNIDYDTLYNAIATKQEMSESDYLIAITDSIANFYANVEFLMTILENSEIVPLKDNADLLYEGTQALLEYNQMLTPPKVYQSQHDAYIEVLITLDMTAESVRAYSRIKNEANLQAINNNIIKLESSAHHVRFLQALVTPYTPEDVKVEQKSVSNIVDDKIVNPIASSPNRYAIKDGEIFKGDRKKLINDALFYFLAKENGVDYGLMLYAQDQMEGSSGVTHACSNEYDIVNSGYYQLATINLNTNQMNVIDIGYKIYNTNHDGALLVNGTENVIYIVECESADLYTSMYYHIKDGDLFQFKDIEGASIFRISYSFAKIVNTNTLQTSMPVANTDRKQWIFHDFELDFDTNIIRHSKSYTTPVTQEVEWQWLRDEYIPK